MFKMYVLVRRDLSWGQRCVQSSHAVSEFMFEHGSEPQVLEWIKDHKTMVILGVKDETEIKQWVDLLKSKNESFSVFVEPDIGDQITAIAISPSTDPVIFKDLKLLS